MPPPARKSDREFVSGLWRQLVTVMREAPLFVVLVLVEARPRPQQRQEW